MSTLDPTVLAAAAARLSPTDLGWLVRVVASPDGDAVLAELDAAARARITPSLCRADCGAIVGVKAPDPTPGSSRQRATRRLGGELFDVPDPVKSSLTPPPVPCYDAGSRSPSVKETAIAVGIRLFMGAGKPEDAARRIVGGMLRDWREGVVFETLAAASKRAHELAEPVGWIRAYVVNNYGPMAARPKHLNAAGPQAPTEPEAAQARRPLATPEALGISPARALKIQEQNRRVTGSGLVIGSRRGGEAQGAASSARSLRRGRATDWGCA